MDALYLFLTAILILTVIYWVLTKTHNHWKNQNVPFVPNPILGFGHMWPVITLKESLSAYINRIYTQTDASLVGIYFLHNPSIIVRDPELVKRVLQTNFLSFSKNSIYVNEKADPILSKNPFFTSDLDTWKALRARTTSHFSGRKLRQLFIIIQEVCSKMYIYNDRKIKENDDFYECELKEYFIRCTGEVVANAVFGIEGQSFEDNPDRLSFVTVAKSIFEPTFFNGIKQSLLFYLPSMGNLLGISLLQKKTDKYFRENIKLILKQRRQSNSAPNDYLQFCKESNNEITIENIVADVTIFSIDVYESSSTALSAVFYHLSQNKEVQEKLRAHILYTTEKAGGAITYDSLKDLIYLDQVIQESMRLTVPLGAQMKVCSEEITLEGSDGLTCHLRPGDRVYIPVQGLHMDSKYWSDPDVFDPDRFSPENQANRSKFVFLPFGEGPRMCVGIRLALMLVKLITASLLLNYSIEHSSKTKVPFEMDPTTLLTYVKGGFWGKFKKVNKNN